MKEYFKLLIHNLTGEYRWEDYNLQGDGDIIVLTEGDDPNGLNIPELGKDAKGILSAIPEFCNRIEVEGKPFWQFFVVCNNDYVLVIYAEIGKFGAKFDNWIEKYLVSERNV